MMKIVWILIMYLILRIVKIMVKIILFMETFGRIKKIEINRILIISNKEIIKYNFMIIINQ
jgi:hypothetical protein